MSILISYDTQITAVLDSFLYGGFHSMTSALRGPFSLCTIISVIILGYGMAQGLIKTPLQDAIKLALKIGAIMFFFFHWDVFSKYVVGLFLNASNEIGSSLLTVLGVKLPTIAGEGGTTVALQVVLEEINHIATDVQHQGSISSWSPYLESIFIYISGYLMIVVSYFEILMAKVTINILMISAPLFCIFCLFKPTQSFFSKWIGTLSGASFVIILVSSVVALNVSILQTILVETLGHSLKSTSFVPIVIISILSILMCIRIASIAYSLGGAVSHGAGAAAVGGFIGASLGRATQAARVGALPFKTAGKIPKMVENRFRRWGK